MLFFTFKLFLKRIKPNKTIGNKKHDYFKLKYYLCKRKKERLLL